MAHPHTTTNRRSLVGTLHEVFSLSLFPFCARPSCQNPRLVSIDRLQKNVFHTTMTRVDGFLLTPTCSCRGKEGWHRRHQASKQASRPVVGVHGVHSMNGYGLWQVCMSCVGEIVSTGTVYLLALVRVVCSPFDLALLASGGPPTESNPKKTRTLPVEKGKFWSWIFASAWLWATHGVCGQFCFPTFLMQAVNQIGGPERVSPVCTLERRIVFVTAKVVVFRQY